MLESIADCCARAFEKQVSDIERRVRADLADKVRRSATPPTPTLHPKALSDAYARGWKDHANAVLYSLLEGE
jgi:hypothetical protein